MTSRFGALLKAWRTSKKLSGADLARQAGISRTTLTRWEAGQTQPRITELEAVLSALDASPVQRREVFACLEAPRAVLHLREMAGVALPLRGDLLRAMRLRQGWTQQQTAQRAGIAQSTLARWERTEDWPSAERLHTLCYTLHAQDAELIALTQGLVTAALPREALLDNESVRIQVAPSLFGSPLADVEFLSLEAQLWHLAQKEAAAHHQLSYTYGCHARFLMEHQRMTEAAGYVERIYQLARSGHREAISLASAAIAASRIVGSGRSPNPVRAVKILRAWLENPLLQGRDEFKAWMYSEIAKHLLTMGEAAAARHLSKQAIRIAKYVDTVEPRYRRSDYARVLLESGHFDEALAECAVYLNSELTPLEKLSFMVTATGALLGRGCAGEAMNGFAQIEEILATYSTEPFYREAADALKRRL